MFQFRRFPPYTYGFSIRCQGLTPDGFPHSGIHGSMPAFGSPRLFADRCVLHRLPVPRHPPCALYSLTIASFHLHYARIVFFWVLFIFTIQSKLLNLCIITSFCISAFLLFDSSLFSFQGTFWWAQMDSNHRPHAYQACALTT